MTDRSFEKRGNREDVGQNNEVVETLEISRAAVLPDVHPVTLLEGTPPRGLGSKASEEVDRAQKTVPPLL